jgi:coenzyme F420-reducing hydrogenase alpha subunit
MVGSLARVNNNYGMLRPEAKAAAGALGLRTPCFNPFMNNVAQVVETAHCVYDAIEVLDGLLQKGLQQEAFRVEPRAGRGIGVVEAPRGILFHEYEYGDDGRVVRANCIIPTNQNHESIEDDFRALAPKILDRPQDEIRQTLEMLVRAYDPCISCSTHYLDVTFV